MILLVLPALLGLEGFLYFVCVRGVVFFNVTTLAVLEFTL